MTATPYAEVDVSALPLIVVRVVGPLSEEGFQRYLGELLAAIQSHDRVALRLHAGALHAFPPRYVRVSAAWLREHRELFGQRIAGLAMVLDSAALRLAVQAMVWAGRPSFPLHLTSRSEDADAWLREQLGTSG